jgi:hypothetical protein
MMGVMLPFELRGIPTGKTRKEENTRLLMIYMSTQITNRIQRETFEHPHRHQLITFHLAVAFRIFFPQYHNGSPSPKMAQ